MKKNTKGIRTLIIDEGIVFDPTQLQLNIIGKRIDTTVQEHVRDYVGSNNGCPQNPQELYQFVTTVLLSSTTNTLTLLNNTMATDDVWKELVKGVQYRGSSPND